MRKGREEGLVSVGVLDAFASARMAGTRLITPEENRRRRC